MPLPQILRAVVGEPDCTRFVLPHQRLKGQIDGQRRSRHHERGPCFRTAKDQQLRWPHLHASFLGFPTMVHASEHLQPVCSESRLQSLQRLIHRIAAADLNQTLFVHHARLLTG